VASPEHLEILARGPQSWAAWRAANPSTVPDLREADLSRIPLANADLTCADLRAAKMASSNLEGTDLRKADLRGTDLGSTIGLLPDHLAGSDLTRAKLPEALGEFFKELKAAKEISDNAQKLFIAMLAACLYSWLTIAATTDANLVTNRASSPLPIIQVSIPIVNFFVVAPILLAGVYFYCHFYLQKLWEELGSLPAFFPDGRPLQSRADPWLLSDLVRSHLAKLRPNRPFLSYLQSWLSALLAWWSVPITLLLFWLRYLPRHAIGGTIFHASVAATSIAGGLFLHRLAADTLRGSDRRNFEWRRALLQPRAYRVLAVAIASAVGLVVISLGAINGPRTGVSGRDCWRQAGGPETWVPRTMKFFHYSPFADIGAADLALKPANWTSKDDLEKVQGLLLYRADLRYADLKSVFLPVSVLTDARLEGADLLAADLRQSQFISAHLEKADLAGADLRDANLSGTDLSGASLIEANLEDADLTGADLTYADFSGAKGLTAAQIESAKNGSKAYFDDQTLLSALESTKDFQGYDVDKLVKEQQREGGQATTSANRTGCEATELGRLTPGKSKIAKGLQVYAVNLHHVGGIVQVQSVPLSKGQVFSVTDLAKLYDFPFGDGRGQRIGIIEFGGGYFKEDLTKFLAPISPEKLSGGTQIPSIRTIGVGAPVYDLQKIRALPGAQAAEELGDSNQVMMDVEIVAAICPKAEIALYFSTFTQKGWVDAINSAIQDQHRPSVLLVGWGLTEVDPIWGKNGVRLVNDALRKAAEAGITVVTASGDDGVSDQLTDGLPHVGFPASSPWVLAVGGTALGSEGIQSEKPWNDSPGYRSATGGGATGGGVSEIFALPDWQASSGIPLRMGKQSGRGVPDVAAAAAGFYDLVFMGQHQANGGTAAAAALWAGLIGRLNQNLGRNLRYFNPVLYKEIGPAHVLHNVTGGDNGNKRAKGYPCRTGWNVCTGWGTPDGQKLLAALRISQQ
jgi:kumamolisin